MLSVVSFEEELKPVMMIYVGNLDYAVTSDDLRALFDPLDAEAKAAISTMPNPRD